MRNAVVGESRKDGAAMSMDTLSSVLRELDATCPCVNQAVAQCGASEPIRVCEHNKGRGTAPSEFFVPCKWPGHTIARKLARVAFVAGVNGEDYAGGKLDAALDVEGGEEG